MGARGPLKILSPLQPVPDVLAGTVAAAAPARAPLKPRSVADDPMLTELWDRIVPELDLVGLISPVDVLTLELMIRHYAVAIMAHGEIDSVVSEGSHGGVIKNPAVSVMESSSRAFLDYAKQTGLTLVSRARTSGELREAGTDAAQQNPFIRRAGATQ